VEGKKEKLRSEKRPADIIGATAKLAGKRDALHFDPEEGEGHILRHLQNGKSKRWKKKDLNCEKEDFADQVFDERPPRKSHRGKVMKRRKSEEKNYPGEKKGEKSKSCPKGKML